jgi:hypothetical protein
VIAEERLQRIKQAASGEVRRVDPVTGGAKGAKPEAMDLVPLDALVAISVQPNFAASRSQHARFTTALTALDSWARGNDDDLLTAARAIFSLLLEDEMLIVTSDGAPGAINLEWSAIQYISKAYGMGAEKYKDDVAGPFNWRRGYAWSLSYAALLRHLTSWAAGEKYDKESGLNHLAHAGWHAITMTWFQINKKGTDDRLCSFPAFKEAA